MMARTTVTFLLAAVVATSAVAVGQLATTQSASPAGQAAVDRDLPAFQRELLHVGFEAASAMPVKPHVLDRSRCQAAIMKVGLELGQLAWAQGLWDRMDKAEQWHKGVMAGELALEHARRGDVATAQEHLNRADHLLVTEGLDSYFRNGIKARTDEARLWLARAGKAQGAAAGGRTVAELVSWLQALAATGETDLRTRTRAALAEFVQAHSEDAAACAGAEGKVRELARGLPGTLGLDVLLAVADVDLAQNRPEKALEVVDRVQKQLPGLRWPPEHRIPAQAELAAVRWRAGQKESRQEVDAALAACQSEGAKMLQGERVAALLAVAEAYTALGDRPAALATYQRALEDGASNPNGRSRAMDLSALCRSMAQHGVEPDEQFWTRIRTVHQGLREPW